MCEVFVEVGECVEWRGCGEIEGCVVKIWMCDVGDYVWGGWDG